MQLKQWTLKSQITCDIMIFHQPLSLGLADIKLEIRCQVKRDQKEKKKKKVYSSKRSATANKEN